MKKLQPNKDFSTNGFDVKLLRGLLCKLRGRDGMWRDFRYDNEKFLLQFQQADFFCVTDPSICKQDWYDYDTQKPRYLPPVGTLLDGVSSVSNFGPFKWAGYAKFVVVGHHRSKNVFFVESIGENGISGGLSSITMFPRDGNQFRPLDFEELTEKDKTIMAVAKSLGDLCPEPQVLNALYESGCLKNPTDGENR